MNFTTTKEELETITKIVDRALTLSAASGIERDRLSVHMDITATHANGCPLKLEELLAADDFNFAHDVFGIARHIDRTTGKLTGCFLPRFAKREKAA